jgi:hypothetical protein
MSTDSATTGTTDQAPSTGTAPGPQGTGTAQGPATGTAQGQASNGTPNDGKPAQDDTATKALTRAERELAKAQARIQELEQASMTEAEKRDRRLAELEAERATWEVERQSMILRNAVFQEAVKAGAVYPDLVVQAISPAQVEWAKDGSPSNVGKVVADARQAYPALFRVTPGTADGGAGQQGASPAPTMNDLIRRKAGRA